MAKSMRENTHTEMEMEELSIEHEREKLFSKKGMQAYFVNCCVNAMIELVGLKFKNVLLLH